ncbi:transcriptional repressor [Vulcanibacillus modesticaldus]|uniref:Transcriptional repressor n=2 Tax=Vulcanibacillus modesticaldus TaxID=337097 RepID=A0A1D2YRX0_9BACI|nr:transcriptional repressor [Vulcanibacillus modesticaldus]
MEKIKQLLRSSNFKLTPQREVVLEVLLENEEGHLSADDVYMLVKKKVPEIGLATVYRTLELLSELNIIQKLYFGENVARYEFRSDSDDHHHHHLECINCGKVEEIDEDWLGIIEEKVEKQYDFKVIDHRLTFQGICSRCKTKDN